MTIGGLPRPEHLPGRTLAEFADFLQIESPAAGAAGLVVRGIGLNSRTVRPGDLYAALPGLKTHGARYVAAAAHAGAVAVLTDPDGAVAAADSGLPMLVVPDPRERLALLAAWFNGRPAERMLTFGVTGTNGKTTTTYLVEGALQALGYLTGLIGTIEIRFAQQRLKATGTTPEAPDLQALMAVMAEHQVDAVAMELSSHAIAQHRVDALTVDVAGFTNLSQDHLDYHHTMQEYFAVKASLFTPTAAHRAVICVDDAWGEQLADLARQRGLPVITITAQSPTEQEKPADWRVIQSHPSATGSLVTVAGPGGCTFEVEIPLPGQFNIANGVLAMVMLTEAGIEPQRAAQAISQAGRVPGRMERIEGPPSAPITIVDYAHSPDSVTLAVQAVRANADPLVVVLGAGGDRDTAKRPLMGRAAAELADLVVVTDDNPRSEDPALIRAAVLDGARQAAADRAQTSPVQVVEIADRAEAIAYGLQGAAKGSHGVLLILGKGHEPGQQIGEMTYPFDDRVVAAQALEAYR